ncbi:MAG: SAM-dependent methyltransferase, partial [Pseudomonadota bacterium]|nr:SAM-dependent methyltransferase [Pseudomonadota bacterium]
KYCYLNPENPNFLYDYGLDRLITEDFYEVNMGLKGFIKKLSKILNANGGVALVIDYGYSYGSGDTLQAVQKHKYVDPLEDPGKADITAHINFSAVKELCKKNYLKHNGPTTQRNFLLNLGALTSLENLLESNNDTQTRNNLTCGLNRLIKKKDMGDLFKVMALFPKNNFIPEGFD